MHVDSVFPRFILVLSPPIRVVLLLLSTLKDCAVSAQKKTILSSIYIVLKFPRSPCCFARVQPNPWNESIIRTLVNETQLTGLDNVPWKRLQISFEPQVAVQYAANVGSWDAVKRQHTRELLRDLRREFHKFPRPGYVHRPSNVFHLFVIINSIWSEACPTGSQHDALSMQKRFHKGSTWCMCMYRPFAASCTLTMSTALR